MRTRISVITFIPILLFILTGCEPTSGHYTYEIELPSGTILCNESTGRRPVEIEGSDLMLVTETAEKGQRILHIQDTEGIIYTFEHVKGTNRGQIEDGDLWICSESWSTGSRMRFIDTTLKSGKLFRIDLDDGEIVYEENTEENEFFLTIKEERCYFYHRGKESEEKLLGLVNAKQQNATIYYRELSNWDEKHILHTFEYAGCPQEVDQDTTRNNFIVRFTIEDQGIKTTLLSYTYVDRKPAYETKWSVDILYK